MRFQNVPPDPGHSSLRAPSNIASVAFAGIVLLVSLAGMSYAFGTADGT